MPRPYDAGAGGRRARTACHGGFRRRVDGIEAGPTGGVRRLQLLHLVPGHLLPGALAEVRRDRVRGVLADLGSGILDRDTEELLAAHPPVIDDE
ncbi:hypothetical protein [Myceligenerans indicum]|uniref:Uncharacterized protein n=1 Tax=Myceligenerans indicum TaxID=2593663 RepID=A0ABS1LJN2_9MICO|nr:hypothetical protein [Myceligenerans indicum]MBL0886440.1 hypothetical protein [Myceligenerans indicum]